MNQNYYLQKPPNTQFASTFTSLNTPLASTLTSVNTPLARTFTSSPQHFAPQVGGQQFRYAHTNPSIERMDFNYTDQRMQERRTRYLQTYQKDEFFDNLDPKNYP